MERGEWAGEMLRDQGTLVRERTPFSLLTVNLTRVTLYLSTKRPTDTIYMSLAAGHIAKPRRTVAHNLKIRLV